LHSADVIHSFWVPNLSGKVDLIPGRANTMWLQADVSGNFRGQCAEFCGTQHANMALTVITEPEDTFQQWLGNEHRDAVEPATQDETRGREIVEHGSCALCHTVAGTTASARTGPDLTHVGSRATLAAGRLPNDSQHMAEWLRDPQTIKPGTRMPRTGLEGDDLRAVVAYLGQLR
jgi:cytochrome c oxidase subunit 2